MLNPSNPIPHQLAIAAEYIKMVAAGHYTCAAISGGPGIGKSFLTEKILNERNVKWRPARGTAAAFINTLYEMRDGGVILLDDSDNLAIRGGERHLNLMKQALARNPVRWITNDTKEAHKNLTKKEPNPYIAPPLFKIECRIVWVNNLVFDDGMDPRLAMHIQPLFDRGLHPVCISREPEHILNNILHLVFDQRISLGERDNNLSLAEANEVLAFFVENAWRFRTLSIRTLQELALARRHSSNMW